MGRRQRRAVQKPHLARVVLADQGNKRLVLARKQPFERQRFLHVRRYVGGHNPRISRAGALAQVAAQQARAGQRPHFLGQRQVFRLRAHASGDVQRAVSAQRFRRTRVHAGMAVKTALVQSARVVVRARTGHVGHDGLQTHARAVLTRGDQRVAPLPPQSCARRERLYAQLRGHDRLHAVLAQPAGKQARVLVSAVAGKVVSVDLRVGRVGPERAIRHNQQQHAPRFGQNLMRIGDQPHGLRMNHALRHGHGRRARHGDFFKAECLRRRAHLVPRHSGLRPSGL